MSNENNSDKLLVETFIRGLEETKKITQNLQSETQSNTIAVTSLQNEVNTIRQNNDWLIKNVRDEGDNKSVMSRLLTLEKDFEDIEEYISEQKKEKEFKSKALDSIAHEDQKGKWQLKIAFATGILGFVATIITTLLSYFFKK